jgi:hypothetical protein
MCLQTKCNPSSSMRRRYSNSLAWDTFLSILAVQRFPGECTVRNCDFPCSSSACQARRFEMNSSAEKECAFTLQ